MIGTCIMPKLLEPHENQCDSMIFCLLFFLHLAPVRSTFDFIIALILFSFFSFRKSIAILPVFLSRYFLCFYCCCCFYSVRKIIGSDFQTLFNGTDNLYVHLFVCFALRVHVSGFSILPIISCFWFFIIIYYSLPLLLLLLLASLFFRSFFAIEMLTHINRCVVFCRARLVGCYDYWLLLPSFASFFNTSNQIRTQTKKIV